MWFRVSSCASTLRLRTSRSSSSSVTSSVQTPTPAAFQRLGGDLKGAALAGEGGPADAFALLAEVGGLAGQGVGAAVEVGAARGRLVEAGGVDRLKPGAVDPDGRAVGRGDPGRGRAGVEEGGEAGRRGQARVLAGGRREPQPGHGAGRAAFHGHQAALALDLEGAGLAALEQRPQAPRMVGVGAHQGVDQGLGIAVGDAQGRGADRQAFLRRRPAGRGHPPPPAGRNRRPRPRLGGSRPALRRSPGCGPARRRAPASGGVAPAPTAPRRWPGRSRPPPPLGSVGERSSGPWASLRRIICDQGRAWRRPPHPRRVSPVTVIGA